MAKINERLEKLEKATASMNDFSQFMEHVCYCLQKVYGGDSTDSPLLAIKTRTEWDRNVKETLDQVYGKENVDE
jgi:hypothetical protein